MSLSRPEREEFLAEPHIAALAVAAEPDRGPLAVPIWYVYEPGGNPWIVTPAASLKARRIQAAGRFTLVVERTEPSVRYVSVEGPVVDFRPATEGEHAQIAERYLGREKAVGYLEFAKSFGEVVTISLRPERWYSADMGTV